MANSHGKLDYANMRVIKNEIRGITPDGTIVADIHCFIPMVTDHIDVTINVRR